jgi:hypothetical protein
VICPGDLYQLKLDNMPKGTREAAFGAEIVVRNVVTALFDMPLTLYLRWVSALL